MDNNYLQKIQEYLNNNVQNDSNENISLNKNQLLECLLMLLNLKDQQNINSNININKNQKNKDEITSKSNTNQTLDSSSKKLDQIPQKQDINNFDEIPLPALKNKEKNNFNQNNSKNCNNFDDMPIKGGSNFNELLEKELSKEKNDNYENYNQNIEPKFKYVPKKRNDIFSVPTTTKKYKYYSDNFKTKNKKKKENNINNNKKQKNEYNLKNNNEENIEIYQNSKPFENKIDFLDFKKKINNNKKKNTISNISYNNNKNSNFKDNNIKNNKKNKETKDNIDDFTKIKKDVKLNNNKNKIKSLLGNYINSNEKENDIKMKKIIFLMILKMMIMMI